MDNKKRVCECGSTSFTSDNRTLQKGFIYMICDKCGKKYMRVIKPEKCFSCHKEYYALDWHTPSFCPHCHRSFVE